MIAEKMTYADPETAARFVNVVASLSRIGEGEEYLGREMLLANYGQVEPTLRTLGEVEKALDDVQTSISDIPGHPGAYLRGVAGSARAVLSILCGVRRPYLELVREILQIDAEPIPVLETERLRSELADGLGRLGHSGSLQEQIESWLEATSMRGDEVVAFGRQIVARARHDTLRLVTDLPEGEGVDSLDGVRNVFYSGRSHYKGGYRGWLRFNVDKWWQRDVFVQVLCHEAYPGHQTFYSLWDHGFRTGSWPLEAALYTRNSATNTVFEGGPEVAMHLIGWDVGDSREALALRVGQVYKDLGRIAMNDVCLAVNIGDMSHDQAIDKMVDHFVLPNDAERVYKFVTDRVSRTHYPQYYYGRRMVDEALRRMEGNPVSRQRFIDILYRTPHTTATFIEAVAAATGEPFEPFSFS